MDEDSIDQQPEKPQSKSSQLIGQLGSPITNLGNNISRTYGMLTNGQIGDGVNSLIGTLRNPYDSNMSSPNSQSNSQQHSSLPTLSDEHLGEPDKNGFQEINSNGQQFLQQAYQQPQAQQSDVQIPQIQQTQPQQNQKGLIGSDFSGSSIGGSGSGGILKIISQFV